MFRRRAGAATNVRTDTDFVPVQTQSLLERNILSTQFAQNDIQLRINNPTSFPSITILQRKTHKFQPLLNLTTTLNFAI